jgi:hypothetical protein
MIERHARANVLELPCANHFGEVEPDFILAYPEYRSVSGKRSAKLASGARLPTDRFSQLRQQRKPSAKITCSVPAILVPDDAPRARFVAI